MLDGVFDRRKNFLDVWRQSATTLDAWPQRDRRGANQVAVQANRFEIVVQIRPPAEDVLIVRIREHPR